MRILPSLPSTGLLFAGCSVLAFCAAGSIARADQPALLPGSLIVSSSTYDRSRGAVASLTGGTTPLANTESATTPAVADNSYVNVWNNESVDASFGVTSLIRLTTIEPHSGHVFGTRIVPTDQVVTSFSSKSELGLHLSRDRNGLHLVFVGYAGANVGALDASNSDAVPGQDPTNPVSFAFGAAYAFPRTIVSMDERGDLAYTPTINSGDTCNSIANRFHVPTSVFL